MNKKEVFAIGLMSGTSLDGLDLVYLKFISNSSFQFQIIASETINYSWLWKEKLQNAIHLSESNLEKLDVDYGSFLGEKVNEFIKEKEIENLDFIASHGHTVFHQPEKGITKQIGKGQRIAEITNCKVVCDFRTQDVLLGGQGAPLVPIGDRYLFSEYDACINLGGFANISFEKDNERIAFDISPVNVVLNCYSQKLGFEYDDKGQLSSEGMINESVLEKLNQLKFYKKQPPKSLGIEWVNSIILPLLSEIENPQDVLRTFTEHVAEQLANNIDRFKTVLFTGGGVFNSFLISRIQDKTNTEIIIPSKEIIDYKEALIFAFLGLLRLDNKINCLSSVTGASKNHSSGVIFNPN